MYRSAVVFILLFSSLYSFSQLNTIGPGTDSFAVMSLLKQSGDYYTANPPKAKVLATEALRISKENNRDDLVAKSYAVLAILERTARNGRLLEYDSFYVFYSRRTGNSTMLIDAIRMYSQDLMNQDLTQTALRYIDEGERIAEIAGNTEGTGFFLNNRGFYYMKKNQTGLASQNFQKSLDIFISLGDSDMINYNKQWLAHVNIYSSNKVSDKILEYLFEVIEYCQRHNKLTQEGTCYDILGYAYQIAGNWNRSLDYYFQSRAAFQKVGYTIKIAEEDLTIASLYLQKNNTDSSLIYLDEGEKLAVSSGYIKTIILAKTIRANWQRTQKNYEAAEKTAHDAQQANQPGNNEELNVLINEYLSLIKAGKKEVDSSVYYALQKIATVKKLYPPGVLNTLLDKQIRKSGIHDPRMLLAMKKIWGITDSLNAAVPTDEDYIALLKKVAAMPFELDTLLSIAEQRQMIDNLTRYKTNELKDYDTIQQQKIALQEKESLIQKKALQTRNSWLIITLFFLVLIGIIGAILFRHNRKISLYKEELRHRNKNNFVTIQSLVSISKETSRDKESFDKLKMRLDAMYRLQTFLYESDNFKILDAGKYLHSMGDFYTSIFSPGKIIIDANDPLLIPGEKGTGVALILNEMITNAFKHAFRERKNAVIHISMKKMKDGRFRLAVSDNGKGFPENIKAGSGTEIMEGLAEQIEGTLKKYNENGACFEIIFM